jgi:hypothetical protein
VKAAALFGVVAAPALAQNSESAPAAAAIVKSKPKTPAGGTATVKVTNWREADLVELQAVETGSANWKKVLGALKAANGRGLNYRRARIVTWICAGNTPTVSRRMCPMSMSARTRRSTSSTDALEAALARSGAGLRVEFRFDGHCPAICSNRSAFTHNAVRERTEPRSRAARQAQPAQQRCG